MMSLEIPNIPHESVPVGAGDEQNEVVKTWGEKPVLDFQPLPHWDLGEKPRHTRFQEGSEDNRFEVHPVQVAWRSSGTGAHQLHARSPRAGARLYGSSAAFHGQPGEHDRDRTAPQVRGGAFKLGDPDYFLIPTAEVPVTNIFRDEILKEGDLPSSTRPTPPASERRPEHTAKIREGSPGSTSSTRWSW